MADVDGDGQLDLFIAGAFDESGPVRNALLLNRGANGFVVDTSHPLAAVPDVYAALWGDYDNDGLTDVYLCRRGSNQLWRQTEKGRWSNVSGPARAEGAGGTTIDGAMFDADHDGDLDLLLDQERWCERAVEQQRRRHVPFARIAQIGLADDRRPSTGVVVADLDADRDADIIVIKKAPPHAVLVNDRTWQYHRDPAFDASVKTPMTPRSPAISTRTAAPELYTSGARGSRGGRASRPDRGSRRLVAGHRPDRRIASQLALADVDGDGRLDLVGTARTAAGRRWRFRPPASATPLFVERGHPARRLDARGARPGAGTVDRRDARGRNGAPLVWRPGQRTLSVRLAALSGRDPRRARRFDRTRRGSARSSPRAPVRNGPRWRGYRSQSGGRPEPAAAGDRHWAARRRSISSR